MQHYPKLCPQFKQILKKTFTPISIKENALCLKNPAQASYDYLINVKYPGQINSANDQCRSRKINEFANSNHYAVFFEMFLHKKYRVYKVIITIKCFLYFYWKVSLMMFGINCTIKYEFDLHIFRIQSALILNQIKTYTAETS